MKRPLLIEKLKQELIHSLADSSGGERKKWIEFIVSHNIPLIDLIDILYLDDKTAMKFSWIVGSLCEIDSRRVKIPNFERTIAKIFYLVEIPEEIEGEAVNIMFNWLLNPEIIVSTKNYSLFGLYKLTEKYSELKTELKEVIEDQAEKNSNDFKKRANKILQKLGYLLAIKRI